MLTRKHYKESGGTHERHLKLSVGDENDLNLISTTKGYVNSRAQVVVLVVGIAGNALSWFETWNSYMVEKFIM